MHLGRQTARRRLPHPAGQNLAFVISEKNGTWGKASKVTSLGALPGGSVRALVQAVSCSSAGHCAAGGLYMTHGGTRSGVRRDGEERRLGSIGAGGSGVVHGQMTIRRSWSFIVCPRSLLQ